MTLAASIVSISVRFPERVVTNAHLRERYADEVRTIEERVLGKLWRADPNGKSARFDDAMAKYANDPFRGCVERRWLMPGEKAIDLEEPAARAALKAAGLEPRDVDLLICCSFFPDQVDVGNAAFLAKRLAIAAPAWNIESACSGSLVALETASSLVDHGLHKNVLVVTSCTYSRISPESDTLAWGNGDGAAAFVVSRVERPLGLVAYHTINTQELCGHIYSLVEDGAIRMHTTPEAGRLLRDTAEPYLKRCVDGVLEKAGMRVDDIELFVFNTPTAWYAAFCCDVLGVSEQKTVNAHPRCANVGPVLMPANLIEAQTRARLREGANVLLYAVGSVSNATAAIVRLPRLALGDDT